MVGRIFARIIQQIGKHPFEQLLIAFHHGFVLVFGDRLIVDHDVVVGVGGEQFFFGKKNQVLNVYLRHLHAADILIRARQEEQVIGNADKPFGIGKQVGEHLFDFRVVLIEPLAELDFRFQCCDTTYRRQHRRRSNGDDRDSAQAHAPK